MTGTEIYCFTRQPVQPSLRDWFPSSKQFRLNSVILQLLRLAKYSCCKFVIVISTLYAFIFCLVFLSMGSFIRFTVSRKWIVTNVRVWMSRERIVYLWLSFNDPFILQVTTTTAFVTSYEGDRSSFSVVLGLCSLFLLRWGPQLLETLTLSMSFEFFLALHLLLKLMVPQFQPSTSFLVGGMHYNLHRKEEWERICWISFLSFGTKTTE